MRIGAPSENSTLSKSAVDADSQAIIVPNLQGEKHACSVEAMTADLSETAIVRPESNIDNKIGCDLSHRPKEPFRTGTTGTRFHHRSQRGPTGNLCGHAHPHSSINGPILKSGPTTASGKVRRNYDKGLQPALLTTAVTRKYPVIKTPITDAGPTDSHRGTPPACPPRRAHGPADRQQRPAPPRHPERECDNCRCRT